MLRSDTYHKNLVGLAVDEAHCVTKWYVLSYSSQNFHGEMLLVSEKKPIAMAVGNNVLIGVLIAWYSCNSRRDVNSLCWERFGVLFLLRCA